MAYLSSGKNKIMGSSVSTDVNVVTVIDENSTDEQVPSALGTKTYVDGLFNQIDLTTYYTKPEIDNLFATSGGGSSEKQIKDWVSGSSYLEGDYIYHEGEIYRCLASNSDVDFDESNWEQVTHGIDELTKEDVEKLLGLTKEEIEAMADLILDTEVRLDKTYSSSKIYQDIQQCLEDSKTYTLEEIAKLNGASYKVVTSTSEMTSESIIYLLANGNTYDMYVVEENGATTKIGNMDVNLDNYFTKAEIEADYLKKVDADGKYTTITTLTTHTNDADIHVTTTDKTKWDKVTDKVDITDLDSLKTEINTLKTALNKKADTDKVVKKIFIRDTSSSDAKVLIQKHWSEFDEFEFYNVRLETSIWTWNAEIYAHAQEYGTVLLRTHGSDVPNIFYGKLCNGVWFWEEIGKVCTTTVKDVPKTTITPIFLNGIVVGSTGATINYIVRNGWCNVNFEFSIASATTFSWADIATGLPKPANSLDIVLLNEGGKINRPIPIKINSSGTVSAMIPAEIATADWWNGNISYPVAE